MPLYAAFTYTPDVDWSAPEQAEAMTEYAEFGRAAADIIAGGAVLYPTSTATTVRVDGAKGGEPIFSDGPYAETKEALTGFYLLDCRDLDHALQTASQIPAAWGGAVEVRPLIPSPAAQDS